VPIVVPVAKSLAAPDLKVKVTSVASSGVQLISRAEPAATVEPAAGAETARAFCADTIAAKNDADVARRPRKRILDSCCDQLG